MWLCGLCNVEVVGVHNAPAYNRTHEVIGRQPYPAFFVERFIPVTRTSASKATKWCKTACQLKLLEINGSALEITFTFTPNNLYIGQSLVGVGVKILFRLITLAKSCSWVTFISCRNEAPQKIAAANEIYLIFNGKFLWSSSSFSILWSSSSF